jgi:hypothetical protein
MQPAPALALARAFARETVTIDGVTALLRRAPLAPPLRSRETKKDTVRIISGPETGLKGEFVGQDNNDALPCMMVIGDTAPGRRSALIHRSLATEPPFGRRWQAVPARRRPART